MRRLQRRVRSIGATQKAARSGYSQVSGGQASPPAVGVMPLAQVSVYPHPGGTYVTLAYQGLAPIYTADGAAVPATAPGRYAQLYASGRP